MENCIPKNFTLSGTAGFGLTLREPFTTIRTYIKNKTKFLETANNKDLFRNECKQLADYLINNMSPPQGTSQIMWESLLKFWLNQYFKGITNYGGCPMILKKEHKELLELKYKEEDFCKKRTIDLKEIENLKKTNSGKCETICLKKCKAYNAWIIEMQKQFEEKKSLFKNCYTKESPKKKSKKQIPEPVCNILDQNTFKELSECITPNSVETTESLLETESKGLETQIQNTDQIIPKSHVQQETDVQVTPEHPTEIESHISQPPPEHIKSEVSEIKHSTKETEDSQSLADASLEKAKISEDVHVASEDTNESSPPTVQDMQLSPDRENTQTTDKSSIYTLEHSPPQIPHTTGTTLNPRDKYTSSILISLVIIIIFSLFIKFALTGMFKKKKKISRRHVKFLRLLVPSFSNKKSKIFTDDPLEHTIYDDEEIIKKIKINELTKNVNLSKRTRDRSKIIVEVHMEVLEEFRNKEWENIQDEFLEICIDEFTKEDNITFPNLIDDDLIIENIKCISDIKKQNILWNKWIQRHKNLSQNLKKDDWFNNLKDEWKREVSYIQEMEEIKKKSSNENQKVSFLEREKDIWRQWISKKGMIIQQHLDQYWNNGLAEELQNISDEYVNEDTKNYVSLLNVEELKHKENYEELYKYIKKKLLTKLCILVLIAVLEECKKEVNLENRESYLDRSINEWKGERYSSKKQEITENIIEYNNNDIENKRNEEFDAHIWKDCFRNEIEDWIREDDLYANSIVSDRTVDKSDEIAEKPFL
ncbi:STP1 protein [Plasmodium malariae]|uniref:STP1 protein n=1 Tax=Plasmodium malariae TaxID=5858 RepID=A0A1D3SM50_PLAMA|nr:STP1 protein [Plasmodium malariae]SCO92880.1 STP1 protein [Plasmodium malariae]